MYITRMACILNKAPVFYRGLLRKNIISEPITKFTLIRNYNMHLTNKTDVRVQQKFRFKDNVSNDYKLIYREEKSVIRLTFSMYYLGWIAIALTSGLVVYLLYDIFVLQTLEDKTESKIGFLKIPPLSKLNQFDLLCFCMLAAISLVTCSRIIPFRIYHNPKEKLYKVAFVDNVLREKQLVTFAEGTAVPVFKNMGDVLFRINGRKILLDEESFPVSAQRERMIRRFT